VTANPTVESTAMWPDGVVPEIAARCPQVLSAPCNDDVQAFDGFHLVTANP
jgi:hypothetical protein